MTKPRTLLFTLFSLSSVAVLLSSCDGDDDTIGTSGGSGGTAASGGSGENGGTSGKGGTAGGTTGGTGGNAEGGAGAGAGGAGARAGNGGSMSIGGAGSPGAAGDRPGGGGNGAESGNTDHGGAGAGGAANDKLLTCQTGCSSSDDCHSQALEGRCDETLHLCVECTEHADCIPKANGWNLACVDDSDCAGGFLTACVDVGGSGRCAQPASAPPGCLLTTATPYPRFGIEPLELVDVCVADSGRCSAHVCITGCTDQPNFCTSVSSGYGDTCDEASGLCHCASDDECTAGPPHCNLTTHRCDECETNGDCSQATTGHECHDGRCGCTGTSACPESSFPDGTPLCK